MTVYPYLVAGWVMAVGLFGIARSRNLIHLIICLSVVQSSTYVLLLSIGFRTGATAPIFIDIASYRPAVDPVVQSLTLTDVVVEATVVALLLALAVDAHKRFGTLDPQALRPMKG
jgi:multicomponent Na+:H+ antiporter subunit C